MNNGKYENHHQPSGRNKPLVLAALLAGLIVLAAAMFLITQIVAKASRVDPFDYISIGFSGYEGNGKAELKYRAGEMIETILLDEEESGETWVLEYDLYYRGIQVECSPEDGLSNGDTVKVLVTVSEDAAKKVKAGEREYTVEGLPEVETVDIFEDIELVYEGIGDLAQARLLRKSDGELLQHCSFLVEPEFGIHNGDSVTVTLQNPEVLAEQFLCVPKETSKTFLVSGLDEYLTDTDFLPEEAIREIIPRLLTDSTKQSDSWFSYTKPQYYKTYFFTAQEGSFFTEENILEIYVCYDEYRNGEYWQTIYTPVVFRNLILHADGSVDLEYENGSRATFRTDPDSIIDRDGYDAEEVYIEYE